MTTVLRLACSALLASVTLLAGSAASEAGTGAGSVGGTVISDRQDGRGWGWE